MKFSNLYKSTLLEDVILFWENYSIDKDFGGYFTCIDRYGKVYDEDKFMWLQGRQAWTFSMLYNQVEPKQKWLEIAKHGIDFIKDKGMTEEGNFYFSASKKGEPLIQPYNIFSDCFAAMAFSQYAVASGDESVKQLAIKTYFNILKKQNNPKGIYEKSTGNRPLKSFALPMILSNLVIELEDVLDKDEIEKTIDNSIYEIMEIFLDKESGLIYEFVKQDGSLEDSFNGRLLNPGHGIEAMWFMIDIGIRRNDIALINKATDTIISILEYSWDKQFGGVFYFMDAKGKPPQQLEWDQKLWWVHLESLVALSKAFAQTKRKDVWNWYEKVHDYSWKHFSDPKNGEWFGYLNRQGEVLLDLKGGKWKGCFHVPRAMYQCWKSFEKIESTTHKNLNIKKRT